MVGAIQLLDEAAELFRLAGFAVAKDREPVLGNLRSSVLIEIERDELAAKRARKKAAEEAEERRLMGLGEAVVAAAMYGSMPADNRGVGAGFQGQDVCIVVDNGSSRASSTVALRKVAARLEERVGGLLKVLPVSLKHSDKASLEELGGQPATLLEDLMAGGELAGADSVTLLPLFLGPSRAVLKSIPQAAATAQEMGLECTVAGHVGMGDAGGFSMLCVQSVTLDCAQMPKKCSLAMWPDTGSGAQAQQCSPKRCWERWKGWLMSKDSIDRASSSSTTALLREM